MLSLISYSYVLPVQVDMPILGLIRTGVTDSNSCEVKTENKKNFWDELIAYFPLITYWVYNMIRTAQKTPRPETFECSVKWLLKAGIVESEETAVAKQQFDKHVPAATNTT
jgi:hypothetical protein